MSTTMIAEVFPPGEFLKDELEARNWTQEELSEIMGRPLNLVNDLITGKRGVTPETAMQLGEALGTGAELWLNLENQYQLFKVKNLEVGHVARKAKLHSSFPIREMVKRGWLIKSEQIEVLEQQVLDFFELNHFDETPVFAHAAKKSSTYETLLIEQLAWLMRAKKLSSYQVLPAYSKKNLMEAIGRLKLLMSAPEEIRHVQKILNECGVGFVVVEQLPGSKIDGACFWPNGKPVIAMSLRLDRIDNFWFVLRHEIEHVLQEHGKSTGLLLDECVGQDTGNHEERVANEAAADFCVPKKELLDYIARVDPYHFANNRVQAFSARLGVHPGLVVGQLHKHFGQYQMLTKHLVKIRHLIAPYSSTDGWGY